MDDRVGSSVGQHPVGLGAPPQVVVPASQREHLRAVALQFLADVAAEEPGAPSDDDGRAGDPHGRSTFTVRPLSSSSNSFTSASTISCTNPLKSLVGCQPRRSSAFEPSPHR